MEKRKDSSPVLSRRKLFKGPAPLKKLSDDEVTRAIRLLRKQFPDIDGLQDPCEGEQTAEGVVNLNVNKSHQDTVQIIYDRDRDHWVTVAMPKLLKNGTSKVALFDSLARPPDVEMSDALAVKVATMGNEKGSHITVLHVPSQQQNDDISCGYFAISNALTFCLSRKIKAVLNHKKGEMASHLEDCFRKGKLTPFPKDKNLYRSPDQNTRKEVLSVYCDCRLLEAHDRHTIEC
ncbi:hypothetical protein ONE63_011510 [Megalurothrips usitatus]|uniref:Ubiquitin-like protease family profile domain-containing protein n=1 Tax=Megalurothrips usitatus TaxID=439358 RepID=A0AAV7X5H8_9NEOP|nr:hypothetical protein ONE63_011510 [Megalurothrips usitatus]